jgi:hypothetical protein
MKVISGMLWFNNLLLLGRKFVAAITLTLAVFIFSTGCSKSKPDVNQMTAALDTNQIANDHMPVYEPPSPANPVMVAPVTPTGGPDLSELNRGLKRWILGNRRRPKNFEDFAATAGIAIPPPPAGKQYIIGSDMHIQLVNR